MYVHSMYINALRNLIVVLALLGHHASDEEGHPAEWEFDSMKKNKKIVE